MKTLHYNEHGAAIEKNPKWCDAVSWILRHTGDLFYPKFYNLATWFWSYSYGWGDIQCFTKIKGYTTRS